MPKYKVDDPPKEEEDDDDDDDDVDYTCMMLAMKFPDAEPDVERDGTITQRLDFETPSHSRRTDDSKDRVIISVARSNDSLPNLDTTAALLSPTIETKMAFKTVVDMFNASPTVQHSGLFLQSSAEKGLVSCVSDGAAAAVAAATSFSVHEDAGEVAGALPFSVYADPSVIEENDASPVLARRVDESVVGSVDAAEKRAVSTPQYRSAPLEWSITRVVQKEAVSFSPMQATPTVFTAGKMKTTTHRLSAIPEEPSSYQSSKSSSSYQSSKSSSSSSSSSSQSLAISTQNSLASSTRNSSLLTSALSTPGISLLGPGKCVDPFDVGFYNTMMSKISLSRNEKVSRRDSLNFFERGISKCGGSQISKESRRFLKKKLFPGLRLASGLGLSY